MAVGDAYGAEAVARDRGDDELAHRTETIRRSYCRAVARVRVLDRRADLRSGLRWAEVDPGPVDEGTLKEEMDAAAGATRSPATNRSSSTRPSPASSPVPRLRRGDPRPEPRRRPPLRPGAAAVGSIAGAESVLLAFDHGAAPEDGDGRGAARHRAGALGQGRANPMGMIFAVRRPLLALRRRRARQLRRGRYQRSRPRQGRRDGLRRAIYEAVRKMIPPPASPAPPTSAAMRAPPIHRRRDRLVGR